MADILFTPSFVLDDIADLSVVYTTEVISYTLVGNCVLVRFEVTLG